VASGLEVAEIRHSGLLRARQTADVLAAALGPAVLIEDPALVPEAPWELAATALEANGPPLLLVGHLPHLARLIGALTTGSDEAEPVRLAPATLVGLGRDAGRWQVVAVLGPSALD
jgi:phosphohistidine phosphatase